MAKGNLFPLYPVLKISMSVYLCKFKIAKVMFPRSFLMTIGIRWCNTKKFIEVSVFTLRTQAKKLISRLIEQLLAMCHLSNNKHQASKRCHVVVTLPSTVGPNAHCKATVPAAKGPTQ